MKEYVKGIASSDAESIIKKTQKQVQEIKKNYSDKAESRYQEIVGEAKRQGELAKHREITRASAKIAKMFMDARSEILKDALNTMRMKIEKIPYNNSYEPFLKRAVVEAIETFEMKEVIIKVRKEDQKLIKKMLNSIKALFKGVEISLSDEDADITGGVIIESKDGRSIVENTLESKFEEIKEEFSVKLFSKLKR